MHHDNNELHAWPHQVGNRGV